MISPTAKIALLATVFLCAFCTPAAAQYGGYGGYGGYGSNSTGGYGGYGAGVGGGYGGYGRGGYGGYGRGGYGRFGGYAGGYYPSVLYRSPSSFKGTDDPYHTDSSTDALQRSMERFRDLREDSRSSEEQSYSNETYKRNHPFDYAYYNRMMTP